MHTLWYEENFKILKRIYEYISYDLRNYLYFYIFSFELPEIYTQRTTTLLVETPGYQINNHEGFNFYVTKGLSRLDGTTSYEHIYENHGYNRRYEEGYARLSLHLNSFKPCLYDVMKGDSLLNVIQATYNFLAQVKL